MNSVSERTTPLWVAGGMLDRLRQPPLREDSVADIVVVGAGIAGLSIAYELSLAGRSVIVLDAGAIGGGMTARTTAHLSNALDDRWDELLKLRGEKAARLAAESHSRAIDRVEEIARAEEIDCDFARLDGYLFLAPGDDPRVIERERDAAHRVGLAGVESVAHAPLPVGGATPALRFPRQGRVHPLKYLSGLAGAVLRRGGRIFADTTVTKFRGGKDTFIETAEGRRVRASAIVVATNTPVNDRVFIHTKQAPYRSFAMAARLPRDSVLDALYWDTADPYHYVRLQPSGDGTHDLLIAGGEDHKTGQADDGDARLDALEVWARAHFPMIEEVAYRWSGQVMEPVDYLGFIGRNSLDAPNIYIATGDSGMGMTHGAIAGMLIADLVLGRENPWARVYDPSRLTGALRDFAAENINVAAQYLDLVSSGAATAPEELPCGAGAVIRRGLRKVAVFRDEHGQIHERSAICPHMGCVVRWNPLEGCWDCPCHGSQFSGAGEVINGPARSGLSAIARASQKRRA